MRKNIFITTVTISSLLLPLSTEASNFTKINVFGDSLADTGNVFNLTNSILPPSPPFFEGRFSDEEIWVDILAENFNLNPVLFSNLETTTATEGINFAFGGSTTTSTNLISNSLFGLQQQIEVFRNLTAIQPADEKALNIISAGSNDYFQALSNPNNLTELLPEQITNNISSSLESLYEVGARNFLVANLADLGATPLVQNELDNLLPGLSSRLNNLVAIHNLLLEEKLNTLNNQVADVNIIILDFNSLFRDVISDPSQFGFSNTNDSCLINFELSDFSFDDVCDQPSEFVFWDDISPTSASHQLIAQLTLDTLQARKPVPESGNVVSLFLLASLAWLGLSRSQGKSSKH